MDAPGNVLPSSFVPMNVLTDSMGSSASTGSSLVPGRGKGPGLSATAAKLRRSGPESRRLPPRAQEDVPLGRQVVAGVVEPPGVTEDQPVVLEVVGPPVPRAEVAPRPRRRVREDRV